MSETSFTQQPNQIDPPGKKSREEMRKSLQEFIGSNPRVNKGGGTPFWSADSYLERRGEKSPLINPDEGKDDSFMKNLGEGFEQGWKNLTGNTSYGIGYIAGVLGDNATEKEYKKWGDDYIASAPKADDSTGQFVGSLIPSVIPTVTAIGLSPFTSGTSLAAVPAFVGTVPLTASSFGSGVREYEKYKESKGEEVDRLSAGLAGLAYGSIEFATERFGLGKLLPKGSGKLLMRGNVEAAEEYGKKILAKYAKEAPGNAKKLMQRMLKAGNIEGMEEVFAEFGQDMVDRVYKDSEDHTEISQLMKNMAKAYAGGALMGGFVGPMSFGAQNSVHNKRRNAQGFVAIAKDNSTGDAVEIINKNGEEYNVLTASGNVKRVGATDLSEIVTLNTDQFKMLLKDKYDADLLQEEAEAGQKRAEAEAEVSKVSSIVEQFGKPDSSGNVIMEIGEYNGRDVVVGLPDPANPDMVTIRDQDSGESLFVDKKSLNNVELIPADELFAEYEAQAQEMDAERIKPLQRGEMVSFPVELAQDPIYGPAFGDIAGQDARVTGVNKENGTATVEVGEGDNAFYKEGVPLDIINAYRVQDDNDGMISEVTKSIDGVETVDDLVDEDGNLVKPEKAPDVDLSENDKTKNVRTINVQNKDYEINEIDGKMEVGSEAMTKKDADKLAKAINDRYPNANFEVEDRTGEDVFADPDFRVVMAPKTEEKETSQDVSGKDSKENDHPKRNIQKNEKSEDEKSEENKQSDGRRSTEKGKPRGSTKTDKDVRGEKSRGVSVRPSDTKSEGSKKGVGADELGASKKSVRVKKKKASKDKKVIDLTRKGKAFGMVQIAEIESVQDAKRAGQKNSGNTNKKKGSPRAKRVASRSEKSKQEKSKSRERLANALGLKVDPGEVASVLVSPFTPKKRKSVQKFVDQMVKGWRNAPDIVVHDTIMDFAAAYPGLRIDRPNEVSGMWFDDKVHLIATHPHNTSYKNIQETIFHETFGHYGFRGLIDQLSKKEGKSYRDKYNELMDRIYQDFSGDDRMVNLARDYYQKSINDLSVSEKRVLAEEFVAHEAQVGSESSVMDRVVSFFRELYETLTGKVMKLDDMAIRKIISDSKKFVAVGDRYVPNQGLKDARFKIVAYNGAAVDFDRFSSEAIGSGTGVQAFGWGLYFTGKEGIAKSYANMLSKTSVKEDAPDPGYTGLTMVELKAAIKNYGSKDSLITEVEGLNSSIFGTKIDIGNGVKKRVKKASLLDYLSNYVNQPRYVYKAVIHGNRTPGEYDFLDWEGAVTDGQRGKVLSLLEKNGLKSSEVYAAVKDAQTGEQVYREVQSHYGFDGRMASLFLLEAGIDGNKYRSDSMYDSVRNASENLNYVVFDDGAVEVESREAMFRRQYDSDFGANYGRVIPRDFFNESKLISLYSRFTDFYSKGKLPEGFEVVRVSDDFEASLSEDGDMYSGGIDVYYNGEIARLEMSYNSGKYYRFPLTITVESEDVWVATVFNESGELDSEFIDAFGSPSGVKKETDIPDFFKEESEFLKQMGVVGLWGVDGMVPNDFEIDVIDSNSGFSVSQGDEGLQALNVAAKYKGEDITFYFPHGETELHFKYKGHSGKAIEGHRGMSESFKSIFPDIRYLRIGDAGNLNARGLNRETLAKNKGIALTMDALGKSPEEIKLATGWEKINGQWGYGLSDSGMSIKNMEAKTLGEMIDHPRLFEVYPELRNLGVEITDEDHGGFAQFNKRTKVISFNRSRLMRELGSSGGLRGVEEQPGGESVRQKLAHELQHAIQELEGWGSGTNAQQAIDYLIAQGEIPDQYKNQSYSSLPTDIRRKVYRIYSRAFGEAEARDAEQKVNLTDEQLAKTPFLQFDNLSPDDLIQDEGMRFRRVSDNNGDINQNNSADDFYSNSLRAVDRVSMPRATGDQWRAMLLKNGASEKELEWVGFDEFLRDNKKPNKEEVRDFLNRHKVEIVDVVKSDVGDDRYISFEDASDMFNMDHEIFGIDDEGHESLITSEEELRQYSRFALDEDFPTTEPTKYSKWQLPGGKNYKELLLTIPIRGSQFTQRMIYKYAVSDPEALYQKMSDSERIQQGKLNQLENYKSSHWDEPNILAHIRFNERTDSDGNKVLFIEEIQSDWAQEGRERGFKEDSFNWDSELGKSAVKAIKDEGNLGFKSWQEAATALSKDADFFNNYDIKHENMRTLSAWRNAVIEQGKVQNMPFKGTSDWINLSMKRMIRYASENGFDIIAWITGEQSADRYDLSKQVDRLRVIKDDDGFYFVEAFKGAESTNPLMQDTVDGSELSDIVGKEIAQKAIEGQEEFEGDDLRVGGNGMKTFYDKVLPATVGKLLKKFDKGVKVGPVQFSSFESWYKENLSNDDISWEAFQELSEKEQQSYVDAFEDDLRANNRLGNQLSFEISPLLRQTALQEGMPMFMRKPLAQESGWQYGKRIDGMLRMWQDQFIDLKRLQDGKVKDGGLLDDEMNAYRKENLSKGRINVIQDEFRKNLANPLIDQIKKIGKEDGVKYEQVSRYLKAKHAPEVAEALLTKKAIDKVERKIRARQISDNKKKALIAEEVAALKSDINGMSFDDKLSHLEGITKEGRDAQAGMALSDAHEIISTFEKGVSSDNIKALHDRVGAINNFIVERNASTGLISADQLESLRSQYKFYVPLRGFAEADYDPTMFSGLGLKAKGRASEAGDPLPYLMVMAQDAIVKGEQNKVKRALFEFVKANPDPSIYEIKNSWFVNSGDVDVNGNEIWQETPFRPDQQLFDDGKVKRRLDAENQRPIFSKFIEETITVMVDGQRVSMIFKKPEIARAFKNADVDKWPKHLGFIRTYTRTLGSLYTQYSPEFALRNLIRDSTTGLINLRNDFGAKVAMEIMGSIPKAVNTVRKGVVNDDYSGKDGRYFNEFIDNGGLTGYSDLQDVSKFQKDLISEIEGIKGGNAKTYTLAMLQKTFKPLDQVNRIFENTIRFSSYKYLREKMNYSPERAAMYAKDITVNFNRKGNFSSFIGSLYLFFNASVQGSERLLRPFGVLGNEVTGDVRRRAVQTAAALPMLSIMLGMINRMLGGKDEDDEYFYDKLNDYTRQHNLILPNLISDTPGAFIEIPLPYGFNVLFAAGDHLSRFVMGKESGGEAALNTLSMTLESFSPIGAPDLTTDDASLAENMVRLGTPTALSPAIDLMINKNFAGYPIYKEPYAQGMTPKPDSEMYFSSVNPIFREITKSLNSWTGGDSEVSGAIDINPETLEHLFGSIAGGVGKFATNSFTTAALIVDGEDPFSPDHIKKVPFVRSYVKYPAAIYNEQLFYEHAQEIKVVEDVYKRYIKGGNRKRAIEYKKENIHLFRMAPLVDRYSNALVSLREKRIVLENMDKTSVVKKRLGDIDKTTNQLYLQFNKEMNKRKGSLKTVSLSEML